MNKTNLFITKPSDLSFKRTIDNISLRIDLTIRQQEDKKWSIEGKATLTKDQQESFSCIIEKKLIEFTDIPK